MKGKIIALLIAEAIIIVCLFIGLHYGERRLFRGEVDMAASDIEYLTMVLKKRNANDCIIEPTAYGWKCTDVDGKIYRIRKNESQWQQVSLSN